MSDRDGPTAAGTKATKIAKITKPTICFVIFVFFVIFVPAAVGASREVASSS